MKNIWFWGVTSLTFLCGQIEFNKSSISGIVSTWLSCRTFVTSDAIQTIDGNEIDSNFLSMRMKQSDWLIGLSQRAVFLHPARCEMQPDLNKKCLLRNI